MLTKVAVSSQLWPTPGGKVQERDPSVLVFFETAQSAKLVELQVKSLQHNSTFPPRIKKAAPFVELPKGGWAPDLVGF